MKTLARVCLMIAIACSYASAQSQFYATINPYSSGTVFAVEQDDGFKSPVIPIGPTGYFIFQVKSNTEYMITVIPPSNSQYSQFSIDTTSASNGSMDLTALLNAGMPPPIPTNFPSLQVLTGFFGINGISYNWPSTQVTGPLCNDGAGNITWGTCGGSGGGGLNSFTSGNLSPLFTTSLGNSPTLSPDLLFTPSPVAQGSFLAGPINGSGAYAFRSISQSDVPTLNQSTTGTAANLSGTPLLPNGVTAATQPTGDNSDNLATTRFVLANSGGPTALIYTVGATPVVANTLVMQDGSGNVIPAALTTSNGGLFAGVALGTGASGSSISVVATANQLVACVFENTPVAGDLVISGTTTPSNCRDAGTSGFNVVGARNPVVGTIVSVSGSLGMVQLAGLGVAGTGNYMVNNSVNQTNLSFGGLNVKTSNSIADNGVYNVAGYASVGLVAGYGAGYTPSTTVSATGNVDGTNRVFTVPTPQAGAFAVYLNGTRTSAFTTATNTITFTTAPTVGTAVTIMATPYDLAIADATAQIFATGVAQAVILAPGVNFTCNDAPMPARGGFLSTISIYGWGVQNSSIQKQTGCGVGRSTFSHQAIGGLSTATYRGFTVYAAGIDDHPCETNAYVQTTFQDIICEGAAGSNFAWGVGTDGTTVGGVNYSYQIVLDNVQAQGSIQHQGKNNPVPLTWTGTGVSSASFTDVTGSSGDIYDQFTVIELGGPGLALCTTAPTVAPTFINAGVIPPQSEPGLTYNYFNMGTPTVTSPGNCPAAAQSQIYAATFDNALNYGFDFGNVTDSNFYAIQGYGAYKLAGALYNSIAGNNHVFGEHYWSGAYAAVDESAAGNDHHGVECDSPSFWCVIVDAGSGTISGSTISSDTNAYVGQGGYFLRGNAINSQFPLGQWTIDNAKCPTENSVRTHTEFVLYGDKQGALSVANPVTSGLVFSDAVTCDGTNTYFARLDSNGSSTADGLNYVHTLGTGISFDQTSLATNTSGMFPNVYPNETILSFHNRSAGVGASGIDLDGFGISPLGWPMVSAPVVGVLDIKQIPTPGAAIVSTVPVPGTSTVAYACYAMAVDGSHSATGASTTITNSNATLSATNYNGVTCPYTEAFYTFAVCRGTNTLGLSTGLIGNLNKGTWEKTTGTNFVKDTGQTASAACPTTNTTGSLTGVVNAAAGSTAVTPSLGNNSTQIATTAFVLANGGGGAGFTLNSLSGAVTLAAGSNISITPSGNTLTIAASGSGGGGTNPTTNGMQTWSVSPGVWDQSTYSDVENLLGTDTVNNTSFGFQTGSEGDSTLPLPINGRDYIGIKAGILQKVYGAGSWSPLFVLSCQPGLGDGFNVIPAGPYPQTTCKNETGTTWTISSIKCYSDTGTSTCTVTNGAGTSLLTGPITASSSYAMGTQSATVTIAPEDVLHFTFTPDGTATKQMSMDVSGTY